MTTIKCSNCGKNVKASREVANYTETPGQPVIVWELTATCSCGAKLRDWENLTRQDIFDSMAILAAHDQAAIENQDMASAAQGAYWKTNGF